jgi:hypothetical protein
MTREEILEYPYQGTITRIIEGHGDEDDTEVTLYEGVMDEHMVTDDEGRVLQTSSYIISIPLTQNSDGSYVIPRSGDEISLVRYSEPLRFVVENAEPSQIGGVSIYVTRKSWD